MTPDSCSSFIRWAGSKRLVLPTILKAVPPGMNRYIEPFAGSAALFFRIRPSKGLIADLNSDLINAYLSVQRDVGLVVECLTRLPKGRAGYYRVRASSPFALTPIERAARFIYLNRLCFNGLYRTNSQGDFNVPYGPPKRPLVGFLPRLEAAARALRSATVKMQDFEDTLDAVKPGDFVYVDPPYAVDDRRIFREYLPGSFTTNDLDRLRAALRRVNEKGAVFLLSYANSREAREISEEWHSRKVSVRRNVAGFAGDRRQAVELLVSNRPLPSVSGGN